MPPFWAAPYLSTKSLTQGSGCDENFIRGLEITIGNGNVGKKQTSVCMLNNYFLES